MALLKLLHQTESHLYMWLLYNFYPTTLSLPPYGKNNNIHQILHMFSAFPRLLEVEWSHVTGNSQGKDMWAEVMCINSGLSSQQRQSRSLVFRRLQLRWSVSHIVSLSTIGSEAICMPPCLPFLFTISKKYTFVTSRWDPKGFSYRLSELNMSKKSKMMIKKNWE